MTRLSPLSVLFAVVLLTSCGSGADPAATSSSPPPAAGEERMEPPGETTSGSGATAGKDKRAEAPDAKEGDGVKSEAPDSGDEPPASDDDQGDPTPPGDATGGDGPKTARAAGPLWPAPGTYTYAQSGWEQFCSGTCNREKLPRRQDVVTRVADRASNGAVVVTETRSEGQVMRTTTRWSRAEALITEVYIRLTYRGFTFEQSYSPNPPAASLRFPLTAGKSWSGEWSGRVSGDYAVAVAGPENVRVAGGTVESVRMTTRTNFRGDFEGVANATLWIDPRTRALIKTAGNLDVESSFGRYASGFQTVLLRGPRY